MATQNLYVNGDGGVTSGWRDEGGDYTRIDDKPTDDGATTTLYTPTAGSTASFAIEDTVGLGSASISSVDVHSVIFNPDPVESVYKQGVRISSTNYLGSDVSTAADGGYTDHGTSFTTNPATSSAWTSSDIDGMEIVIQKGSGLPALRLTQMYVVVNYTAGGLSNKQYLGFF